MIEKMMDKRQARFREEYRSRIAGWYNGYFHVAVIYALGGGALYYYIQHVRDVGWWEWLTIPVVFLLCNILDYPARSGGALGTSRPASVPYPSGLVWRLCFDILAATG